MEKRAEFNFALIFSIVIGVIILILSIYGAIKIGDTQKYKTDTEIAKQIAILTNPMQSGFAEGKLSKIEFNSDTRINNFCVAEGFGKNEISVSTRSRVGEEWTMTGGSTSVYDKYIFSILEEAEDYYIFSKPFYFPYKVSDLIILTSEKYCFISPPNKIEDDINSLNFQNIEIGNCSSKAISVCFNSNNCDINVYGTCSSNCDSLYDEGYIEKQGDQLFYVGNLVYGAIFSDKTVYKCNVERLMYRSSKIAEVFSKKADLMNARDCNTNLKSDLIVFNSVLLNSSSEEIIQLNQVSKEIERKNERELCGLW